MHPSTDKMVAIGGAVVIYARDAHTFNVGIKCRHCNRITILVPKNKHGKGTYCILLEIFYVLRQVCKSKDVVK